jgi:hypothetical protein
VLDKAAKDSARKLRVLVAEVSLQISGRNFLFM